MEVGINKRADVTPIVHLIARARYNAAMRRRLSVHEFSLFTTFRSGVSSVTWWAAARAMHVLCGARALCGRIAGVTIDLSIDQVIRPIDSIPHCHLGRFPSLALIGGRQWRAGYEFDTWPPRTAWAWHAHPSAADAEMRDNQSSNKSLQGRCIGFPATYTYCRIHIAAVTNNNRDYWSMIQQTTAKRSKQQFTHPYG